MWHDHHSFMKSHFTIFLFLGLGVIFLQQPAQAREKSLLPNQGVKPEKDLGNKERVPLREKSRVLPKERRDPQFYKRGRTPNRI